MKQEQLPVFFDVSGQKGDFGEKGVPGDVGFTGRKGERGFKGSLKLLCVTWSVPLNPQMLTTTKIEAQGILFDKESQS